MCLCIYLYIYIYIYIYIHIYTHVLEDDGGRPRRAGCRIMHDIKSYYFLHLILFITNYFLQLILFKHDNNMSYMLSVMFYC